MNQSTIFFYIERCIMCLTFLQIKNTSYLDKAEKIKNFFLQNIMSNYIWENNGIVLNKIGFIRKEQYIWDIIFRRRVCHQVKFETYIYVTFSHQAFLGEKAIFWSYFAFFQGQNSFSRTLFSTFLRFLSFNFFSCLFFYFSH